MTAGSVVYAYSPGSDQWIGYETGDPWTGCSCAKCANGYVYELNNIGCKKGHNFSSTWAPGWGPQCPHGYPYSSGVGLKAHCGGDSGYDTPGYRAPCGRMTTKTDPVYGYVTRTRTTTYNKEAGCLSSTLYDKSDASISTRMGRNSYNRSCTSSPIHKK